MKFPSDWLFNISNILWITWTWQAIPTFSHPSVVQRLFLLLLFPLLPAAGADSTALLVLLAFRVQLLPYRLSPEATQKPHVFKMFTCHHTTHLVCRNRIFVSYYNLQAVQSVLITTVYLHILCKALSAKYSVHTCTLFCVKHFELITVYIHTLS